MFSRNWKRYNRLALIFLFCFIQIVFAQKKKFKIEEWEIGLNKRQPPVKIMDAVGFKEGMIIGEVGAGTGRMTMWLADRVGDTGKVYANDIDRDALKHLEERCKRDGFTNIETILGDVADPKLPKRKLDIVFMINVYHHLDEPIPLIANILPSLKKGGLLAIVECDPDKVEWGESHGCIQKKDMTRHLEKAGFNVIRIENILNEDRIYISEVKDKDG